jgi:hypothetical protein
MGLVAAGIVAAPTAVHVGAGSGGEHAHAEGAGTSTSNRVDEKHGSAIFRKRLFGLG